MKPRGGEGALATAGAFLALFALGFRLMFSASASSFLHSALADLTVFLSLLFVLFSCVRTGRPLRVNLAAAALLFFALSYFIAARRSYYPRAGVRDVMDIVAAACLFLVVSGAFFSRREAARPALFLAAASVTTAAVALYQYLWELPRMLEEFRGRTPPFTITSPVSVTIDEKNYADFLTRIESMEIFSTFLTSNVLAGFLALSIPLALGLAAAALAGKIERRLKIGFAAVFGGMALLQLALLPLTKSRGGLAAAGVAVGAFAMVLVWRFLGRKVFAAGAGALVLAAGFGVLVVMPKAKQTLAEARTSFDIRLGYWRTTARVIEESPLEGTGPGNFDKFYVKHKGVGEREVKNPHNALLMIWAQAGVFSLLFLVAFWVLVFAGPRREDDPGAPPGRAVAVWALPAAALVYAALLYSEGGLTLAGDLRLCMVVLAGSIVGAIVIRLFWSTAEDLDEGLVRAGVYSGVIGLLLSSMVDMTLSDAGATAAAVFAAAAVSPRGKTANLAKSLRQALVVAAAVAVGVFVFASKVFLPFWQSEMLTGSATAYLKSGDLTSAAASAREALKVDPSNSEILTLLGNTHEAAIDPEAVPGGNFNLAEGLYLEAAELDCLNRAALEGLARMYFRAGPKYMSKALEIDIRLLAIYPNNSRYHVIIARTLEKLGNSFEAARHYRQALAIDERVEQHGIQLSEQEKAAIHQAIARNEAALSPGRRQRE